LKSEETMSKIIQVKADFAYSPNGYDVDSYQAGDIVEVGDECAAHAIDGDLATEVAGEELVKAQAAHDKLVKAADKAEAAADKAEADAAKARQAATDARALATRARVGTSAEEAAAGLADD
jgi:multidrug efflux pump subunit AcrA (membrane-fusion protein)